MRKRRTTYSKRKRESKEEACDRLAHRTLRRRFRTTGLGWSSWSSSVRKRKKMSTRALKPCPHFIEANNAIEADLHMRGMGSCVRRCLQRSEQDSWQKIEMGRQLYRTLSKILGADVDLRRMESRFGRIQEMLRRLMKLQSKTPSVVPITNPNQDLTGILLAEYKEKEIRRKGYDEESFIHQEPPPRASIKGGSRFPKEEIARRELCGGVVNHYGRHFGQEEWPTGDGGGQDEPWDRVMQEQMEERWESHHRSCHPRRFRPLVGPTKQKIIMLGEQLRRERSPI
ncbi:hypothetical protein IEQ34_018251 [Dendrobium chrysotoxum]|uniref:Uncharacterized protein n=1 Tax=Dendrobium chrysotoxum TaxID=161865 RepID=A0AAV7GCR2_DENCH|nr:hypothetical protein IEQ34_018251 [Dendrobium chrysotoxum]